MSLPYNPKEKQSIIDFAKNLVGKSIANEFKEELEKLPLSKRDKGQLGKVIEQLYFQYKPNSDSRADFYDAGLELKSSGLKQLKNGQYRAKERLVLSIINYLNVVDENFENDFLKNKNGHLLLIFYLYVKGINQLASEIKLVGDWKFPPEDLQIIKNDWLFIRQKIIDGKAHELSEGDTFYLGACTKGATALKSFREQPNNKIKAKQRAFSLRPSYLNHIIANIAGEQKKNYGKILNKKKPTAQKSIEDLVMDMFRPYAGKTTSKISNELNLNLKKSSKNYYACISKAILGIELDKKVEEFEKAEIAVKTIRVEENDVIEQSISFPAFKFEEIYEEHWISSNMKELVEKKFLFIFFKSDGNEYKFERALFWNMPYEDRNQVRLVWLKTKLIVQRGEIFKEYAKDKKGNLRYTRKGELIKLNNFPKSTENRVCHIRPHGRNAKDTYTLPVKDKILGTDKYTKQCFWFNKSYVKNEIYLKNKQHKLSF